MLPDSTCLVCSFPFCIIHLETTLVY
ncbi:hypothetical protein E2C01_075819 [Portunus trituberculatus]|uniref:Uncharacterized protein n=1 Tax=Portunus trituberculatus TaxID=210409 RepID=A0A5B7IBL9_PORTR|nr:hypothetical protein [Portunus trituberculatus]